MKVLQCGVRRVAGGDDSGCLAEVPTTCRKTAERHCHPITPQGRGLSSRWGQTTSWSARNAQRQSLQRQSLQCQSLQRQEWPVVPVSWVLGREISGPAGYLGSSLEFPASVRSWEEFGQTRAPAAEGWPCQAKPCQPKPCPSPPFRADAVSGFSSDSRGTQAKPTRREAASVLETCGGKSATGPDSLAKFIFQHQSNYSR